MDFQTLVYVIKVSHENEVFILNTCCLLVYYVPENCASLGNLSRNRMKGGKRGRKSERTEKKGMIELTNETRITE